MPITKEVQKDRQIALAKEAELMRPVSKTTEQSLQTIASVTERIRNNSNLYLVVDSNPSPVKTQD